MSKRVMMIVGVVLVIAILGIVGFTQLNKKPESINTETQTSDQAPLPTAEGLSKGSIQSLIAAGKSVSCDVNYPEMSGKGIVYVSGKKVRGDFTTQVEGKEMLSHMIFDGETSYIWSDGVNQGTKFKMDPNQKFSANPSNQTADLSKEVDMSCQDWNVDSSKFSPPSTVKFTDMSSLLNTKSSGAPKMDASLCDNITDPEGKAACLKALGGN